MGRGHSPLLRSGHFADAGIPGLAYYGRNTRGGVRHPARRSLHRHADSHAAVRYSLRRIRFARRHAPGVSVPSHPEECFQFAPKAFDLAERLQTPVLVLSDLDIGMNDWMCPDFKWDESYRPDRGKVLDAEHCRRSIILALLRSRNDGIPQRTLPGVHPKGAYFARGSGHTQYGGYTEDSKEYQVVIDRLRKK